MIARYTHIIYTLLGTVMLLSGWQCRKDEEAFRAYVRTLDVLDQAIDDAPDPSTFTTFTLSGFIPDTSLTTASGLQVRLIDTEQLFVDGEGNAVSPANCGNVQVEITEVYKRGDMLARGLHSETTDGILLDALAMVLVQVRCDEEVLQLNTDRNILVRIPDNSGDLDDKYRSYQTAFEPDTLFRGWNTPDRPAFFAEWPVGQSMLEGYEIVVDELGWVACGRPQTNASPSEFCVTLDAPYNSQNTRIYLVYESVNSVSELRVRPNTNLFCNENVPLGYFVQVVSMTNIDSRFELGNFFTETGTNSETSLVPSSVEQAELVNFIRGL